MERSNGRRRVGRELAVLLLTFLQQDILVLFIFKIALVGFGYPVFKTHFLATFSGKSVDIASHPSVYHLTLKFVEITGATPVQFKGNDKGADVTFRQLRSSQDQLGPARLAGDLIGVEGF